MWPVHCVMDTPSANFSSQLTTKPTDFVQKKGWHCQVDSYSAFASTDHMITLGLGEYLKSQGVTRVFVAGLASDFCVKFTSIDSSQMYGFDTYMLKDASRGIADDLTPAYEEMAAAGVKVITTEDLALIVAQETQSNYMRQAVTFVNTISYDIAPTSVAYDKGYAKFLGIYSSESGYTRGTSVTGFQTSRRGSSTISWLAVLTCATYEAAIGAAAGKNTNGLMLAIQDIIKNEYPVIGNAVAPSNMADVVGSASYCNSNDGGLSGGDIGAIVVGSFFAFFLIVAIVYLALQRQSQGKDAPRDEKPADLSSNDQITDDPTVSI